MLLNCPPAHVYRSCCIHLVCTRINFADLAAATCPALHIWRASIQSRDICYRYRYCAIMDGMCCCPALASPAISCAAAIAASAADIGSACDCCTGVLGRCYAFTRAAVAFASASAARNCAQKMQGELLVSTLVEVTLHSYSLT